MRFPWWLLSQVGGSVMKVRHMPGKWSWGWGRDVGDDRSLLVSLAVFCFDCHKHWLFPGPVCREWQRVCCLSHGSYSSQKALRNLLYSLALLLILSRIVWYHKAFLLLSPIIFSWLLHNNYIIISAFSKYTLFVSHSVGANTLFLINYWDSVPLGCLGCP